MSLFQTLPVMKAEKIGAAVQTITMISVKAPFSASINLARIQWLVEEEENGALIGSRSILPTLCLLFKISSRVKLYGIPPHRLGFENITQRQSRWKSL